MTKELVKEAGSVLTNLPPEFATVTILVIVLIVGICWLIWKLGSKFMEKHSSATISLGNLNTNVAKQTTELVNMSQRIHESNDISRQMLNEIQGFNNKIERIDYKVDELRKDIEKIEARPLKIIKDTGPIIR